MPIAVVVVIHVLMTPPAYRLKIVQAVCALTKSAKNQPVLTTHKMVMRRAWTVAGCAQRAQAVLMVFKTKMRRVWTVAVDVRRVLPRAMMGLKTAMRVMSTVAVAVVVVAMAARVGITQIVRAVHVTVAVAASL